VLLQGGFLDTEMTDTTVPTLPPSALFRLFADRCVAPARLAGGTRVPCSEVRVQTDKLASLLLASAFWNLREQRLIDLSIATKKRWMFETTHVEAVRLKEASLTGLDGLLLENFGAGESDDTCEIVCRAFSENDENPWRDVVKGALPQPLGCEQVAVLEPQFEKVSSSWERFASEEPDLHNGLLKRCAKAIRCCKGAIYA
jgi:hypothetical protein